MKKIGCILGIGLLMISMVCLAAALDSQIIAPATETPLQNETIVINTSVPTNTTSPVNETEPVQPANITGPASLPANITNAGSVPAPTNDTVNKVLHTQNTTPLYSWYSGNFYYTNGTVVDISVVNFGPVPAHFQIVLFDQDSEGNLVEKYSDAYTLIPSSSWNRGVHWINQGRNYDFVSMKLSTLSPDIIPSFRLDRADPATHEVKTLEIYNPGDFRVINTVV